MATVSPIEKKLFLFTVNGTSKVHMHFLLQCFTPGSRNLLKCTF